VFREKTIILFTFLLIFGNSFSQIRINEVMYSPASPMKEWFEIYNVGNAPVNLQYWKWKNGSQPTQIRAISMRSVYLYPNTFAIVCDDSSNIRQSFPGISGIILQSEGWSNLANTGYENIIILNSYNQVQDSLRFNNNWGGTSGYSLERKSLLDSTNLQSNWGTSLDPYKGTPNRINSITPKQNDLLLKSFTILPLTPYTGDSLNFKILVKNIGLNPANDFSVKLFHDLNLDSIPQQNELIYSQNCTLLNPNDSLFFNYTITNIDSGMKQYIGYIDFSLDEDTINNKFVKRVNVGASLITSGIIINEVMYAPVSPAKEWFEIFNLSSTPINIQNWKWRDAAQSNPIRTITTNNININANSYAVICEDSVNFKQTFPNASGLIIQSIGWNALNNTGNENVVLYNSAMQTVDSLTYNNSWGGSNGFSLERINPQGATNLMTNWGTCINSLKATPNKINSITPKQNDLLLKSFTIFPLSPKAGDSLFFKISVKNIGLSVANNFSVKLFSDLNLDSIPQSNELIFTQYYSSLNLNDSIFFNYALSGIDSGMKQYIGYIDYSTDEDTNNNKFVKRVNVGGYVASTGILINEIMYNPQAPEPEWVELLNNSSNPINIKNWKIADSSSLNNPIIITLNDKYIQSHSYLVIAKNNSIILKHPLIDSTKVIYLSNLPTLNNDKDVVTILNSSGLQIDYVSYKSSWGGTDKYSLERLSPNRPSNDSSNWVTSIDCEYSTPTRTNSFINVTGYQKADLVINEIMYDPIARDAEYIELYNPTSKILDISGWKLSESVSYSLSDSCNLSIKPGDYIIITGDTAIYNRFSYLRNPSINQKVVYRPSMSLNNSGEILKLYDALNNLIDSVYYSTKWHNPNLGDTKGYALERINPTLNSNDPANWSSSANTMGGTPGLKNSIFVNNIPITSKLSVSPNPFFPDGDGRDQVTFINYKLNQAVSQIRVKIYDVKGRLVRNLVNNQNSGNEGTIIFNGYGDDGQRLRIGIYIIFFEAVNSRGGTADVIKSTVVLGTKLN
jgi:hypothetical protein